MNKDYELLMALRHHTRLSLEAKISIINKRDEAEKKQIIINSKEHCDLGCDYSEADALERALRMKVWQNKITDLYVMYGNGQDFYDFSVALLMNMEEKRREKVKARKLKHHK